MVHLGSVCTDRAVAECTSRSGRSIAPVRAPLQALVVMAVASDTPVVAESMLDVALCTRQSGDTLYIRGIISGGIKQLK